MPPTILLSCESISKSYGVKPLFADLSIGLAEGDHIGLVGPNGSGKSTLLKIMAGVPETDRGAPAVGPQHPAGHAAPDTLPPRAQPSDERAAQNLSSARLQP